MRAVAAAWLVALSVPWIVGAIMAVAAWPLAAAEVEVPANRLEGAERAVAESEAARSRPDHEAANVAEETEHLRRELVKSAAVIQGREEQVSQLEARLAELEREEAGMVDWLKRSRDYTSDVLMALQRLARHPVAAIVAHPLSPADTVRGGIVLRAAVGEIERRADALRRRLDELAALRGDVSERGRELSAAKDALEAEQNSLNAALAAKTDLQHQAGAESRETVERVHRLSSEAGDLRDLITRLESAAQADTAVTSEERNGLAPSAAATVALLPRRQIDSPPITGAQGNLPYPVVGRVVVRYGESTGSGLTSKGITIESRTGAQVVAPHDGRVAFAGQFRGYGQVLIIDHGEAYHTLLAGLSQIDTVVGQLVFGGEPVGVMRRSGDGKPRLYLELRRNNRPVDPLPWLIKAEVKVSG